MLPVVFITPSEDSPNSSPEESLSHAMSLLLSRTLRKSGEWKSRALPPGRLAFKVNILRATRPGTLRSQRDPQSKLRVKLFMNAMQHSEAAAKKEILKWTSRPAYPTAGSLFIPLKPSAMFDAADEEALLNGLQIQWYWQAAIIPSTLPSPCEVGQAPFRILSQGRCHLLIPDFIASTLPSSPWLHQHILILSLSHTSRGCLGMSQRLLPGLMLVFKLGTFPQRQENKQTDKQGRPLTNQNPI